MEIKGILTSNLIAIAKEAIHGNDRPCLLALKDAVLMFCFPKTTKLYVVLAGLLTFPFPESLPGVSQWHDSSGIRGITAAGLSRIFT